MTDQHSHQNTNSQQHDRHHANKESPASWPWVVIALGRRRTG
jgi:hypothetical protein